MHIMINYENLLQLLLLIIISVESREFQIHVQDLWFCHKNYALDLTVRLGFTQISNLRGKIDRFDC